MVAVGQAVAEAGGVHVHELVDYPGNTSRPWKSRGPYSGGITVGEVAICLPQDWSLDAGLAER